MRPVCCENMSDSTEHRQGSPENRGSSYHISCDILKSTSSYDHLWSSFRQHKIHASSNNRDHDYANAIVTRNNYSVKYITLAIFVKRVSLLSVIHRLHHIPLRNRDTFKEIDVQTNRATDEIINTSYTLYNPTLREFSIIQSFTLLQ